MFTINAKSTRMAVSAVAAVTIVSFGALAMDQGHLAGAPRGTVEVGELTPVDTTAIATVTLPEVTVIGKRESQADAMFAATTQLPEIVVVAKRVAHLVAQADGAKQPKSALDGSAEGALLK